MKRFNEHFYNVKVARRAQLEKQAIPTSKIEPIGLHFTQPNHDVSDIQISVLAFITLTPESKDALSLRLKVEKKWIHLMRCPAPTGLNIFD